MALRLDTSRSLISKKLVGAFIATFALFIQPLVGLNVPAAFAATSDITQLAFTNVPVSVEQDNVTSLLTVALRNAGSTSENLDTPATKLKVVSSSVGGRFSSNGTSGWTATPSFTMASGSSSRSFYYKDSSVGTPTLTATAADNANVSYSWTAATQQVTVTPTPAPNATLTSTLGATAKTKITENFKAKITKASGSSTPNVRVKTTLADPSQEADVTFEYEHNGSYYPISSTGGVTYFGASAGFPLSTATSLLRVTFNAPGVYEATSQIVDAATGSPIGNPVTKTVTVTNAVRYVSTAGNDAGNNCAVKNTPCKTIQRAINQANEGETIRVASGIYSESVNVNKSVNLLGAQANTDPRPSIGSARTIGSSDETIVKALKNQQVFKIAADDVIINGFEITQEGGVGIADAVKASSAQSNLTIKNNFVVNATDEAIQLEAGDTHLVTQNFIQNPVGDGITLSTYAPVQGENLRIINNDISGSTSSFGSIYLYGTSNVTIRGNVIDTQATGIALGSDGLPVKDVTVSGNTILTELRTAYSALAVGVAVDGDSDGITITGNTIKQDSIEADSRESTYPDRFNLIRIGVAPAANPTDVVVRNNNLSKINPSNYVYVNPGVTNKVNVTRNWWNSDSNPSSKINNPSSAKFEPWLCEEYTGQASPRQSINGVCDQTDPEINITPVGKKSNKNSIVIRGTVTDDESDIQSVTVKIDGVSYNATLSGSDWSIEVPANALADGDYSIKATAKNTAGLSGEDTKTFTVDSTPPAFYNLSTLRNADGSYTVSATSASADIDTSTVKLLLNGSPISVSMIDNQDGTFTWTGVTPVLVGGLTYSFMVKGTDAIGNETVTSPHVFVSSVVVSAPTIIDTDFSAGDDKISSLPTVDSARTIAHLVTDGAGGDKSDAKAEVLGTNTKDTDSSADKVAAIAPSEDGWKLWGVAWYWYLLALGALGIGSWYAMKWYRGREEDF